jgi:DNA primase
VQQATGIPTWATLGTSGLEALVLPPEVREVVVCADRDPDGGGERAARVAAQRWLAEGRVVRVALPPDDHKDFNDALREESAS